MHKDLTSMTTIGQSMGEGKKIHGSKDFIHYENQVGNNPQQTS